GHFVFDHRGRDRNGRRCRSGRRQSALGTQHSRDEAVQPCALLDGERRVLGYEDLARHAACLSASRAKDCSSSTEWRAAKAWKVSAGEARRSTYERSSRSMVAGSTSAAMSRRISRASPRRSAKPPPTNTW